MTRDTGFFHEDEVAIAVEVFDAAVAGTSDYTALGAEVNGAAGRLDLLGTDALHARDLGSATGSSVDPAHQGEGIGSTLAWRDGAAARGPRATDRRRDGGTR